MGMQINNNLAANNSYRNLNNTQTDLGKSLEKLSSGLRINRASDDAAGLALSEGLRSQIGGLTVASRNAQDGINAVQTAEGGLNQAQAILQRLRDLGVQAANDTNNEKSRDAIQTEAKSLTEELGRIGDSTNFNGRALLDGSATGSLALKFQVGADGNDQSRISVDLKNANVATMATDHTYVKAEGERVTLEGVEFEAPGVGDPAKTFTVKQGDDSSFTFTLTDGMDPAAIKEEILSGLGGASSAKFTVDEANGVYSFKSTDDTNTDAITIIGAAPKVNGTDGTIDAVVGQGLDFSTADSAQAAINTLTQKITSISSARAEIGASQNRLESAVKTISTAKENLTAAESRIRDTDMAEEMVKFTRNNILSQAGTAMLAQANQSNQGVLQLLR